MKQKSITRIADQIAKSKAQYNEEGGTYQPTPKDFARLTWLLEKIFIPKKVEQYTQADLERYITEFLENKGHVIEPEMDELINAENNPQVYTIHSTKAEKQAEKAATKQLLAGELPCPNCGEPALVPKEQQPNPEYPTEFACSACATPYTRKDLVSPDNQPKEEDGDLSQFFPG